jgi:isoquinoline 1-oxidoreductase
MSEQWQFEAGADGPLPLEPERYELDAPPLYRFHPSRRDLFRLLGGGIVVLLLVDGGEAQEGGRRRGGGPEAPREVGAWLHIGEDGQVTVYTGKVEVGQNIRTSLTQVVAEELPVAPGSIRLVMGDTALTPFDQGTFGSRTTPAMAPQLRRAAAAAREALLDLAAVELKAERSELVAAEGRVHQRATGESRPYGLLTKGQKITRTVEGDAPTTPAEQWKIAGRSALKVDGRVFVTGRHRYTSDIKLPGMLYGKVLRPAALGATLVSVDTKAAEGMPGIVVARHGDAVGVVAPSEHQAARALAALRAEWKPGAPVSDTDLFAALKQAGGAAGGGRGDSPYTVGKIDEGLAAAEVRLAQSYSIAYIAHAPLEPRAAVARWENDALTVWTGTQRPFGVRGELARAFGLPEERVRVIVPDTGSGYGGKHTGEAAVEAAWLARAAGKPVKLVWTREEEFTWAYFRPAGVIEVESGARKDGTLTAWTFRNYNSGGSAIRTLYDVPNQRIEFLPSRSPLRQGSYRALAATANHFARETHMDELAHAVGLDPLAFRLRNLTDPRLRAVFEAAAKGFGWGSKPAAGRGFGIAGGFEKGGYVATCAEVEASRGDSVRVVRTVTAFECGAILNPEHLKNQVEGAVVQGLGGALFEAIRFRDGKIENPRFSAYRVPRFRDTPRVEVVLLDRKDLPSAGGGEAPIVGIAPAIGNALFAATGRRLRSMPLLPGETG